MTRIRTTVAVLAIALPIIAIVAGCGGGSSSSSEDPEQVLDQTFNNPTKITSGKLDLSIDGSAEGQQSGNFSATITGPFQTDPSNTTAFPQLDLAVSVSGSQGGPSISFDGSLIATKDNAYVEYQGQTYEVGTALFKKFAQAYERSASQAHAQNNQQQSASSIFKQFGVDPSTWLTNVSNEGTTDVDGQDTIHIHGDADVSRIVSDLNKIAQQAGSATQSVSPAQLDQLKSAVKSASIDVYAGTSDKLLRKLSLALTIEPPASSGVTSVNVNFSVTLSDVNQPQTVSAPSGAKPLTGLLQQFGINGSALGALGAASGAGAGGSSAYANCLKGATSAADIQKCAQRAGG